MSDRLVSAGDRVKGIAEKETTRHAQSQDACQKTKMLQQQQQQLSLQCKLVPNPSAQPPIPVLRYAASDVCLCAASSLLSCCRYLPYVADKVTIE